MKCLMWYCEVWGQISVLCVGEKCVGGSAGRVVLVQEVK